MYKFQKLTIQINIIVHFDTNIEYQIEIKIIYIFNHF